MLIISELLRTRSVQSLDDVGATFSVSRQQGSGWVFSRTTRLNAIFKAKKIWRLQNKHIHLQKCWWPTLYNSNILEVRQPMDLHTIETSRVSKFDWRHCQLDPRYVSKRGRRRREQNWRRRRWGEEMTASDDVEEFQTAKTTKCFTWTCLRV